MPPFEHYRSRYAEFAQLERHDGVLTVTFHTAGGPWVLRAETRDLLPALFIDIAHDAGNRVVILAGTGDSFCAAPDPSSLMQELAGWGPDTAERWRFGGQHAARKLLEIEAPVILCLNGSLLQHAEIFMAADLVLAAPAATVQDFHGASGMVPGGDAQVVWETLLGHSRAKYFLLTGQVLDADTLHAWGVVHELVERDALGTRAQALAAIFVARNRHVLRYTKAAISERLRRHLALEQPYTQALVVLGAHSAIPERLSAPAPR